MKIQFTPGDTVTSDILPGQLTVVELRHQYIACRDKTGTVHLLPRKDLRATEDTWRNAKHH